MRLGGARYGTRRFASAPTSGVLPDPMPSPVPLKLNVLGLYPLGTVPMGWGPAYVAPPPAPIYSPHRVWAGWLSGQIGMPVNNGRFPPRAAFPRVSYHLIDRESFVNLSGAAGLGRYSIQIDAYHDTDAESPSLIQRAIFRAMASYRGPTGSQGYLQSAIPGRILTDFIPKGANEAQGVFREMSEWDLFLAE